MEVHDFYRVPANRGNESCAGIGLFRPAVPHRHGRAVPASVYEVTRSQPLRTGVRDVQWDGRPPGRWTRLHPPSGRRDARVVGAAAPAPSGRRQAERGIGQGPAGATTRPHRPHHRCRRVLRRSGFVARIPPDQLRLAPGEDAAHYELLAQVAAPSARRGSSVGNPELAPAGSPAADSSHRTSWPSPATRVASSTSPCTGSRRCWSRSRARVLVSLRVASGRDCPSLLFLRRTDASRASPCARAPRRQGIARIPAETSKSVAVPRGASVAPLGRRAPDAAGGRAARARHRGRGAEREAPRFLTVTGRHIGPLDFDRARPRPARLQRLVVREGAHRGDPRRHPTRPEVTSVHPRWPRAAR